MGAAVLGERGGGGPWGDPICGVPRVVPNILV